MHGLNALIAFHYVLIPSHYTIYIDAFIRISFGFG